MNSVSQKLTEMKARLNHPDVRILGVAKGQPMERVNEAVAAGLALIGNNYVQEGAELMKRVGSRVKWHFIGHIQSRKVKDLVGYDCVQSLDRLSVAQNLNRRLEQSGKTLSVLVELNLGLEAGKSGVDPKNLGPFLSSLEKFSHLEINGLMALPPPLANLDERRPFFRKAKRLYDEFSSHFPFHTLSLGTSDDFLVAIEEGANLIRLGTILFGPRTSG